MKKIITLLILSFILVGCGNKTTSVSNGNDALLKVGSYTLTHSDVYSALLSQNPAESVKFLATAIILNKEVGLTDDVKAKAEQQLEDFKTSMGENAQMFLDYYGYKDFDDYYNQGIVPTIQQDILVNQYLTNNFDTLVTEYQPKKVRIIEVTDASLADKALEEIKAGKEFATVATTYSSSSYSGSEQLVYTASELPEVILTWMNLQTTPTLSPVLPDTTNATNYIVQVTLADASKFKDEVISSFALDTTFMDIAIEDAFKRNEFTLYDKFIYDQFAAAYPQYITK